VLGRAAAVGSATGSYLRPVEMETAEQAGCRAPGRPGDAAWYARSSVNLPNAITSIRLALVPVFAWLHLTDRPFSAMVVFTVAALSDGIDGLLARLFDQRTRLGAILDPIADKLLVATSLVLLVVSGTLPPWLFLTALLRDAAVGSLGLASRLKGRWLEVEPTRISKYATFTVMATVFLALGYRAGVGGPEVVPYLRVVAIVAAQCLLVASLQYGHRLFGLLRA